MAVYMHGTYGEFAPSIGRAATSSGTVAVYVGTAPVNLIRGFADAGVINEPVYLTSLSGVRRTMGNSKAWDKFTLCEAFGAHFYNEIANVGPIVAINVLDPAKHKKSAETTQQLIFANGRATIDSDTIILDTLLLANLVEGVDFSIDYDFTKSQVIIESIGDTDITGTVPATFSEVEPAAVTTADIVGGVTANGVYTGLGCVSLEKEYLRPYLHLPEPDYQPDRRPWLEPAQGCLLCYGQGFHADQRPLERHGRG